MTNSLKLSIYKVDHRFICCKCLLWDPIWYNIYSELHTTKIPKWKWLVNRSLYACIHSYVRNPVDTVFINDFLVATVKAKRIIFIYLHAACVKNIYQISFTVSYVFLLIFSNAIFVKLNAIFYFYIKQVIELFIDWLERTFHLW